MEFNSETLTNILCDNINKLLGDKFNEDEFVKQVVDELVKQGAITATPQETTSDKKAEPVQELDTSQYDALVANVKDAIRKIQGYKQSILNLISQVDSEVQGLGDTETIDYKERDKQITALVEKIRGSQERFAQYVQVNEETKKEIDEKSGEVQSYIDKTFGNWQKSHSDVKAYYDKIQKTLKAISGNNPEKLNNLPSSTTITTNITLQQLAQNPKLV